MDLIYVLDYRYFHTPDGAAWTPSTYAAAFWDRYLAVFDRVHVVSRSLGVEQQEDGWQRVDSDRVLAHRIPYYLGPAEYLLRLRSIHRAMDHALAREGAVILRVPSALATCAESMLRRTNRPFGIEVVGDPWESFAPGSISHPLRPFFRRHYARNQRRQCQTAVGTLYVSGHLQRSYPPGQGRFSTVCSDADLGSEAFADAPRPQASDATPFRIVTVASLDQVYKGIDTLLEAVAASVKSGIDLRLTVVGDGKHAPALKARAALPDLAGRVEFLGQLPAGEAVRKVLKDSSVFVLPSRTEGMPRALLEAMALGLPCLGARVGGIPEILNEEDTFPHSDVPSLVAKLREMIGAHERLAAMSARNHQTALEFRDELLGPRRRAFYGVLRD